LLCSGYRKSIDVILIPILISIDGSKFLICHNLIRQNRTTCIVYQYFKELLFFSESGCKDRNFQALLPNVFGSFFIFLFPVTSEAKGKRKNWKFPYCQSPSPCQSFSLASLAKRVQK